MEREACVCYHGFERSDLCAEIIIIIIIIIVKRKEHIISEKWYILVLQRRRPSGLVGKLHIC